jgi:hypothetical protein
MRVFQVARIGQKVKVRNLPIRPVIQDILDKVRPDETATACNEDLYHFVTPY